MAEIHGTCDDRFEVLEEVLAGALDAGDDLGASVAVTIEGRPVVDIWGGWTDTDKTTPWREDTLTNVWSSTKTVTSLAALVLADRGELDVHARVATYWPEFAANGKEAIEVRHLMSHTSGVSGWERPFAMEDMYDWEASTSRLAAQAPWWEPGTASGYHAANQGHLVGEVVRRITGSSLKAFVAEEISGPLGADFQIGLAPGDVGRVANVVPSDVPTDLSALDPDSPVAKTFAGPLMEPAISWTEGWRAADLGAVNGHGNARSLARIQSVVANGGEVDGVRLLSPKTIALIFDEQSNGIDLVLGMPVRFGIGYALADPAMFPYIPAGRICFWGGWGGSMVVVDTERHMTITYVMNRMHPGILGNTTSTALITAAYGVMGVAGPVPVL